MQKNLERRQIRVYRTAEGANKSVLLHKLKKRLEKTTFWKTGATTGRCHEIRTMSKKIATITRCMKAMTAKKTKYQKHKTNRKIIRHFKESRKIFKVI
jgi:hypothetical protein